MEQNNDLNNVMTPSKSSKEEKTRGSIWGKKQIEYKRKLKRTQNLLLLVGNLMLAIITGGLGFFTVSYYQNQKKHVEAVQKNLLINRTIELLDSRDAWYKDHTRYAIDTQLNIALSWDGYIKDEEMKLPIWKDSNKKRKLELLVKNMAVRDIFAFFEKVKMLHKKEQIDLDYFYNDIFYSIVRLEEIDTTIYPSVSEYLDSVRNQYGFNPDLFDGYEYCRDSIIDYEKTRKQGTQGEFILLEKKKKK